MNKKFVYKNSETNKYHKWSDTMSCMDVSDINSADIYQENSFLVGPKYKEYIRIEFDKEYKALRKSKLLKINLL